MHHMGHDREKNNRKMWKFNYLGRSVINDERDILKIKSRTTIIKSAFTQKKALLTNKLDLKGIKQ